MKTFPTLYKRTKTGAIQFWQITVTLAGNPMIVKKSGQLDTANPLIHREDVFNGKQKRSPIEQAEFQAESDWKRKRDEGYKSLKDLGIIIVSPTDEAEKEGGPHIEHYKKRLSEMLEQALPQFNTDASGNAKPMLAKTVNWDKVKYPCLVQPKLDGVRCLMVAERDENETAHKVTFLSRSGKPYTTLSHIESDVRLYTHSTKCDGLPFILDGEIYSEELTFQDIVAAVKKQRPESLQLRFRAYDTVSDDKQQQRWERTVELVDSIQSPHIQLVLSFRVDTKEDVKKAHDQWVSEGYEGAMIRHLDGVYGQGQRSSDLLKVKEFDETEFRAKFLYTGQREEDLLVMCETKDGKEFTAKLTGNREYKSDLVKEHGLEQKLKLDITIKHFGWTDDGLPRFPIGKAFRDE